MPRKKKLAHEKHITEYHRDGRDYLLISMRISAEGTKKTVSRMVNMHDYTTPSEAMQAAIMIRDQLLRERQSGKSVVHNPTVGEVFRSTHEIFAITAKTWIRHSFIFRTYMADFDTIPLIRIKPADIQKNLNMTAERASMDATERVLSVWRQIYRAAAMTELPVSDKTIPVKLPVNKKPAVRHDDVILDPADFNQFITWVESTAPLVTDEKGKFRRPRIIFLLKLLYYTGARPSEVMALDRSDFDLEKREICISKRVGSTAKATRQIITLKTASSYRIIPISSALYPIVLQYFTANHEEHLLYDHDGLPFETNQVACTISNWSRQSGVHVTMYMCRHSLVHSMREANIPPRVQQDILGHTSFSMTQSYDRSSPEERRSALDKLS